MPQAVNKSQSSLIQSIEHQFVEHYSTMENIITYSVRKGKWEFILF